MRNMKLGITGTIAAGKTTVSILLKQRGIPVFNSDQYAKMAYIKGSDTYHVIVREFGNEILDENQEIDLKKLADLIFSDEDKRKQINAIVHPFVKEGILKFFSNHADLPIVAAEVPLLFEAGFEDLFDEIVVVTCDEKVAIDRMMEYRNYTYQEAYQRYHSQLDEKIQISKADRVLYNNLDLESLMHQINAMLKELKGERHGD